MAGWQFIPIIVSPALRSLTLRGISAGGYVHIHSWPYQHSFNPRCADARDVVHSRTFLGALGEKAVSHPPHLADIVLLGLRCTVILLFTRENMRWRLKAQKLLSQDAKVDERIKGYLA